MRYFLIFTLYSISAYCLAAPCRNIEDQLERLACYEKVEACNEITLPAERLACFEKGYKDESKIVETPLLQKEDTAMEDPEIVESTQYGKEFELGTDIKTTETSVVESSPEPIPHVTETAIQQAEHAKDNESFPVKTLNRLFTRKSSEKRKEKKSKPSVIFATIVNVELNHRRIAYLTLDNGQVWREIARSGFMYRVGSDVTITKGILGSTNLSVDGMSKYVKAKRVK